MPYLDRDEPELYLWMFFNAWVACYREEINAMVEHPYPVLGYANTAHPKTSDEANAVMWLRYMFVYGNDDGLYLGRAIPRAWFARRRADRPGERPDPLGRGQRPVCPRGPTRSRSGAKVDLKLTGKPPRTTIRFRHPGNKPIAGVTINGREHRAFDAGRQDVDITGLEGPLEIVARF